MATENSPLGVDIGTLSVRIASLKGHPADAIRIGVHWASAYGKATTPTSQRKPPATGNLLRCLGEK